MPCSTGKGVGGGLAFGDQGRSSYPAQKVVQLQKKSGKVDHREERFLGCVHDRGGSEPSDHREFWGVSGGSAGCAGTLWFPTSLRGATPKDGWHTVDVPLIIVLRIAH